MQASSPSSSEPSIPTAPEAPAPGAEAGPAPAAAEAAATPAAASAPAPAPAAPAGPQANLKGLPPIKRPEVVRAEGGGDRGPRPPRPFGPRGPRPGSGPGGDSPPPMRAPETKSHLQAATDEAKAEGVDAAFTAQMDAAMAGSAPAERPSGGRRKERPDLRAVDRAADLNIPRQAASVRGPRLVQSGREHRRGHVVSVGPTDIFIEFGPKELGVLARTQYKEGEELPAAGAEVEVVIDRYETSENLFICSRPGAVQKAAWELLEIGQVIEARVTGVNKGGLELEVAGHKAFMPASQVSLDRVPDLSVFVGEKLTATVAQVDRRGAGNIVLSRRDLLSAERKEKAAKLKAGLQEGQVLDGVVRKIMPFGAFVDLGGLDGLVHISDMTYDRVMPTEKNVHKYVQEGQAVKVQILKLDLENDRIALGMKQLAGDPFMTATNSLTEGAEVTGRVVRLAEFGAFVELAPGVDGLVHVSEISRKRVNKPSDELKLDQIITARVLKVDPDTRKISLSIKALLPAEPVLPGSREAKNAEKAAMADARLKEIQKETPELRRMREQYRNKKLQGGFGKKYDRLLGGGLGDLKIGG